MLKRLFRRCAPGARRRNALRRSLSEVTPWIASGILAGSSVLGWVGCTPAKSDGGAPVFPHEDAEVSRRVHPEREVPMVMPGLGVAGAPGYVRWCASGGAPIVGAPVVDAEERSYVATSDGYLHAFERDGRFRWSYTVKGTPLGSVSLRPSDGAILIGTTGRWIYAINQDGSLRFRYPTLTPVWSGLHALNPSTVVFLGHDTRLYAISNSGTRKYRVRAPSAPMGEPVVAPGDVVWLPLEDGVARFESAFRLERFELPGVAEQAVVLGSGAVVRAGTMAYFVARDGTTRELGPARLLAGDGRRVLVVRPDGGAVLVESSLDLHEVRVSPKILNDLSAAPTLVGDQLWCPLEGGRLSVRPLAGGEGIEISLRLGGASTPVVGPSGRWALVPSRGGEFCAVEISSESLTGGFAPKVESSANSAGSNQ